MGDLRHRRLRRLRLTVVAAGVRGVAAGVRGVAGLRAVAVPRTLALRSVVSLPAATGCATALGHRIVQSGGYQGRWVHGCEVTSFLPCGFADRPGYGAGAWLACDEVLASDGTEVGAQFRRLSGADDPPRPPVPLFLRVEGTLETGDPDGYGHLGSYTWRLTLHRILGVSREDLCR